MRPVVLLLLTLAVSSAFAEKQPISRYQPIIDRQMFGPLPPGFDPTKSPNDVQKASSKDEKQLAQEKAKLQSSIHFSVLNVASDGQPEVGFTDNSDPKMPRHYFMKVGETCDGWTVKEADAESATMTIAKGEIEVPLTLGGDSAKGGGTTSRAGTAPTAAANGARRPGALDGGLLGSSLRAKYLRRKQEDQAAAEKLREEAAAREAERREREDADRAQRDADRAEMRRQIQEMQDMMRRQRDERGKKEISDKSTDEGENGANNESE